MKPLLHNRESGIPPFAMSHVPTSHCRRQSVFFRSHSVPHFLSILSSKNAHMKSAKRRKSSKPKERWRQKLRAACPLRVGNDIMTGLQCLVGGSFYSSCQDQCAIVHTDGMSVHVHVPSVSCDGKLTRGFWGGPGRDAESWERWGKGRMCWGVGVGGANREVSLRKKKKKAWCWAEGQWEVTSRVKLRSN